MPARPINITLDGRGDWRAKVFVEHLWNGIKYEDAYFKAHEAVCDARGGISRYSGLLQLAPSILGCLTPTARLPVSASTGTAS